MTQTRIKICGITSAADARSAVELGADAIGLVFYPPSPRAVTPERALSIIEAVPPFVTTVALFVDESAAQIGRVLEAVPVDMLQFHGAESATFCAQFKRPWIKAVRMRPGTELAALCREYRAGRGILLDSWQEGVPGGTGTVFDWNLAANPLPLPLVLAGGLNEHNVGAAVARLRPAAVDVSGGVERAPGDKDREKIRRFIAAVRSADALANGATDDQ
ncbi:MAG: phosphoribosylanthranilate isomerase [Pseudomonadales bacterium]|nr:phosphoribosylanthranilate isomerase [Halieaceae bacterium]MCP5163986.1 phosphoribosylanthranilate isomerase [Pseudomonadales bacterium]MCP5188978.1 phosphoribosylanthranilate isomerase [Pseudomonadales bacterium]MCP5203035.1 phosphoribosylanthranilate isomerase [Pseudomonadales bacterium]